jgi:hypothetical protein
MEFYKEVVMRVLQSRDSDLPPEVALTELVGLLGRLQEYSYGVVPDLVLKADIQQFCEKFGLTIDQFDTLKEMILTSDPAETRLRMRWIKHEAGIQLVTIPDQFPEAREPSEPPVAI